MNSVSTKAVRSILIGLTVLACAREGQGQDAPKYSNEFLAIGVGARALGMSGASVSSVNDVTSGYWNPSGLLGVKGDIQVAAMHSEYFAGIAKYDYLAIAKPIDSSSTLAFSFIRFGVDDIPNTTELIDNNGNIDYDRITSFSAADQAFILSYGRRMKNPNLRLGGSAKVIYRRVGEREPFCYERTAKDHIGRFRTATQPQPCYWCAFANHVG